MVATVAASLAALGGKAVVKLDELMADGPPTAQLGAAREALKHLATIAEVVDSAEMAERLERLERRLGLVDEEAA